MKHQYSILALVSLTILGCGQTHYLAQNGAVIQVAPGGTTHTTPVNTSYTDKSNSSLQQQVYSLYYPNGFAPPGEIPCGPNRLYLGVHCSANIHWAPVTCNSVCDYQTTVINGKTWSLGSLPPGTPYATNAYCQAQPALTQAQALADISWTQTCFKAYPQIVGSGTTQGQLQAYAKGVAPSNTTANIYPVFGTFDATGKATVVATPTSANAGCNAIPFGAVPVAYCSSPLAYSSTSNSLTLCNGTSSERVTAHGVHYCYEDCTGLLNGDLYPDGTANPASGGNCAAASYTAN